MECCLTCQTQYFDPAKAPPGPLHTFAKGFGKGSFPIYTIIQTYLLVLTKISYLREVTRFSLQIIYFFLKGSQAKISAFI